MAMSEADLEQIFRVANDHSNRERSREAEQKLRSIETERGFGMCLLRLIRQTGADHIRLLAAIQFKNFIKRNWIVTDDGQRYIDDRDRHDIKQAVVDMMLEAPPKIKTQLSAAITLIAQQDFPAQWQDLLPTLTGRLQSADEALTFGALEIIESITKRYINASLNRDTHDAIRYFITVFAETWLALLLSLAEAIKAELPVTQKENNTSLKYRVQSATLLVTMFWDLHTVDCIDWYEEQMSRWAPLFLNLLQLEDQRNCLGALDAGGPLDKLRAKVMSALVLYNQRYEEQYRNYVPQFVQTTCQLVTRLDGSERYDELVFQSIFYLTSVVKQTQHRGLFDRNTIELIVQHIIIPNVQLRESDVNMFEIDGEAYVSRDLEGSDMETRRRVVADLISALCEYFETEVTEILLQHINRLLAEYKKDPAKNFVAKDAAVSLTLALAVKGKTRHAGATILNERVDVSAFFEQNLVPHLRGEGCHPIISADTIKFLIMFRSKWPDNIFMQLLGLLVGYLGNEDYVLHTYAAFAIDKVLSLKVGEVGQRTFRYPKSEVEKHLPSMLEPLLSILASRSESHTNKHVMAAILRVVVRSEDSLVTVIQPLLQQLGAILERVAKKPGKPDFNHLLFEVIAASISSICGRDPSQAANFEQAFGNLLFTILESGHISEFHPYVYQLLALLLRVRPDVSEHYQSLFDKLLHPDLWNQDGTIRAISGMFGDYLSRVDVNAFVDEKRLQGMLGVFQKLLSDRGHDFHAFEVLRSVFEYIPLEKLRPYRQKIFSICFQRLQMGKRVELCCNFVVCLGSYIVKNGVREMIAGMDLVQSGIFGMVLGNVWVPYARKISDMTHRRITTFAMVLMLESDEFWNTPLKGHIPQLFQKTIELFEANPEEEAKGKHVLEDLEAQGFDTKFSRLSYAFAPKRDMTHDLGDPREALVKALCPRLQADGRIRSELKNALEEVYVKQFNDYCKRAGVNFTL